MHIELSITTLKSIVERLTRPAKELEKQEQQQKARLLASMALVMLLAIPIIFPLWAISGQGFATYWSDAAGIAAAAALIYGLSRTRHYMVGAVMLVVALLALIGLHMAAAPGSLVERMAALNFLVTAVLASSLLLPRSLTLLLVVVSLVIISIFFFVPGVPFALPYAYLISFWTVTTLGTAAALLAKRYKQQLIESEELYRSVVAAMSEGVILQGADGQIQACNAAAEGILGLSAAQMISRDSVDPRWQAIQEDGTPFPGEEHPAMVTLRDGRPLTGVVMGVHQPEGELRWISINSQPLLYPGTSQPYAVLTSFTDITETKQREQALREAQRRYSALFEQAHDAVFILDLKGRHLEANHRAAEMLGYSVPEIQRLTVKELSAEAEESEQIRQQLLGGAYVPIYERRFRRKDGRLIPVEIKVELVRDLAGQPLHIQSVVRDITERKQAEEALRQSEERQRAMLAAIPDLIFRNRVDGTYLDFHASDPAQAFVPPEVFLGKKISDVLPANLAQEQMAILQQVVESGKMAVHEFEMPFHGEKRNFEMRAVRVTPTEVLSIIRDVTELWQTRRQLEKTQVRLEFAVDTARLAWWEMDLATGKVQFDERKVRMAGYDPQAFQDITYHAFTNLVHPDEYEAVMQAMRELIDGRQPTYSADYRLRTASGDWIWFHDRGELRLTDTGQPVVRGYVIDITESKQAQQRAIELALERERVHMLTTFIQNASHEFRTPLGIINNAAFVMAHVADADKQRHKAAVIQEQVQRMARLLDMLLLVTRLETCCPTERVPIDMGAMVQAVCQGVLAHGRSGPTLRWDNGRDLPPVLGNEDELLEAFSQVLDNAFRFTPATGVVTVVSEVNNGRVCLEICDNGPGIPPENLPHIFETFWRQDEAHTTPGFGLGLAIANKVITRHGGCIDVKSEVGVGSAFILCLPVYPSREKQPQNNRSLRP